MRARVSNHAGPSERSRARPCCRLFQALRRHRDSKTFAGQWLACKFRCQRFAATQSGSSAWLRAHVGRYSVIKRDLRAPLCPGTHVYLVPSARNWAADGTDIGSRVALCRAISHGGSRVCPGWGEGRENLGDEL
jgi:hypothetical protein